MSYYLFEIRKKSYFLSFVETNNDYNILSALLKPAHI